MYTYLTSNGIPGLAVGIVRDGRTMYTRGFGVADPASGRPVTEETLFHTASVSKTFVAAAILRLVEVRLVELGTPVMSYLPYFTLADERAGLITIGQLLSHTSGMTDVRDYGWTRPESDDEALERYVLSLADKRLRFSPGDRYSYSNMGYEVLGDVIAKVSGMPFEDHMRERILAPVGMGASTFLKSDISPDQSATPHVGRSRAIPSGVYPYHRAHAPSSTLHSNAVEMSNWIIANLNRGVFEDNRILESASYDLLWEPHATLRGNRRMALGWMLADSQYGLWVFHGGRDVGFRSHLSLYPDIGGGIVILSNWSDAPLARLRQALVEAVFASPHQ